MTKIKEKAIRAAIDRLDTLLHESRCHIQNIQNSRNLEKDLKPFDCYCHFSRLGNAIEKQYEKICKLRSWNGEDRRESEVRDRRR